jgi:nucleoside-diphosphate-sugar epimerase
MRVLVTGHHGYIGSVLAPTLAAAGHDVTGLDTFYYEGCDFGEGHWPGPELRHDLRDVPSSALEGFDAVVHYGALSNDPLGDFDPELTYDINHRSSVRLAEMARQAGVRRFVFASSCSMYGASGSDALLDERSPFNPLTAYAESKVRAEAELMELATPEFAPVSMRNATVYGASPRLRLDIVLNNLAGWAHTTGRIRLLSDGTSWRPLVHVRDVARTALALIEAPEEVIRGEAFNVGTDEQNYLVRDLARILSEVTACEVELSSEATPDPRSYRVAFGKLAATFPNLRLEWNAERGARELLDAYREIGMTRETFEGSRYVRLKRLSELIAAGRLDHGLHWAG